MVCNALNGDIKRFFLFPKWKESDNMMAGPIHRLSITIFSTSEIHFLQ